MTSDAVTSDAVTSDAVPGDLRSRLGEELGPDAGGGWLSQAVEEVRRDPAAVLRLLPAAGRRCGRHPLPGLPGWTADEAARALLLAAVPADRAADLVTTAYRHGDGSEKRAVLKALPLLGLGAHAVPLLHDALRTNDTRLVAAALGPGAAELDRAAWRQGVLKCVFTGIPLDQVHDLEARGDAELAVMLDGLRRERQAAGRPVPDDALALLRRLTAPPRPTCPPET